MAIKEFKAGYYFLSNYFHSPFEYEGLMFDTVEHAFHWCKTHDLEEKEKIRTAPGPNFSKKLGRKCTLRPDWEEVKDSYMEELVRAKFNQNPKLKSKLLKTGDQKLVEGNTWNDTYWGVCKGRGKNRLGQILMKIRDEFKNESN